MPALPTRLPYETSSSQSCRWSLVESLVGASSALVATSQASRLERRP